MIEDAHSPLDPPLDSLGHMSHGQIDWLPQEHMAGICESPKPSGPLEGRPNRGSPLTSASSAREPGPCVAAGPGRKVEMIEAMQQSESCLICCRNPAAQISLFSCQCRKCVCVCVIPGEMQSSGKIANLRQSRRVVCVCVPARPARMHPRKSKPMCCFSTYAKDSILLKEEHAMDEHSITNNESYRLRILGTSCYQRCQIQSPTHPPRHLTNLQIATPQTWTPSATLPVTQADHVC